MSSALLVVVFLASAAAIWVAGMMLAGTVDTLDDKQRERVLAARDVQLDRAMDLLKGLSVYTKRQGEKLPAKVGDKVAAR